MSKSIRSSRYSSTRRSTFIQSQSIIEEVTKQSEEQFDVFEEAEINIFNSGRSDDKTQSNDKLSSSSSSTTTTTTTTTCIPSADITENGLVSIGVKQPYKSQTKVYATNADTFTETGYDFSFVGSRRQIKDAVIVLSTHQKASSRFIAGGISTKSMNSLRLNTGTIKTLHLGLMTSIVQDPIQCGYLLHFSNLEHNSENLCFLMMVSRFRDAICQDVGVWPKSWIDVDKEIEGKDADELAYNTVWPSKRLQRNNIQKLVDAIYDNFLSEDSVTQICISANMMERTEKRMLLLDLYGPEVFQEALIDPIKTIVKDVIPRFLTSATHAQMLVCLDQLKIPVTTKDVNIPKPNDNPLLHKKEKITSKRMFTLKEITTNLTLYNEFLKYLESIYAVENLLCIRMLDMFVIEITQKSTDSIKKAIEYSLLIYRYFVAKDSPYEVSLHSKHKKEIMISLANIQMEMFDELKKSVMTMLSVKFNAYKSTESYQNLWKLMKIQQKRTLKDALIGLFIS